MTKMHDDNETEPANDMNYEENCNGNNNEAGQLEQSDDPQITIENLKKERDQYKDQIELLLQNIQYASSLASMGSDTYRHSFSRQHSIKNHDHNHEQDNQTSTKNQGRNTPYYLSLLVGDDSSSYLNYIINNNYDDIDEEKLQMYSLFLESTALPKLLSSIHQLQSNKLHLSSESYFDTTQLSDLNFQVEQYKIKYKKYSMVSKQLWKDNQLLKQELNKMSAQNKALIKSIRKLYKQKKKEDIVKEEQIVAAQSLMHENVMRMKQKQEQQQQQKEQLNLQQSSQDKWNEEKSHMITKSDSPNIGIGNRIRASTHDSALSEFEDFDYDILNFGSNSKGNKNDMNLSSSFRKDNCDNITSISNRGVGNSLEDSCDSSSLLSVNSCSSRSFVTDDNLPTLRLDVHNSSYLLPSLDENADKFVDDRGTFVSLASCKSDDKVGSNLKIEHSKVAGNKGATLTYTLIFPIGTNIGLQFKEILIANNTNCKLPEQPECIANHEIEKKNEDNHRTLSSLFTNRSRSFSDSSAVLKNRRPKQSLTRQTQIYTNTTSNSDDATDHIIRNSLRQPHNMFEQFLNHFESPTALQTKKASTDNVFTLSTTREKTISSTASEASQYVNAFLVSGFDGFDTTLNVRPTLFARLIAVNDQSLLSTTKNWTLDELKGLIMKCNSRTYGDEKENLKLTFRNETLTKELREHLRSGQFATKEVIGNVDKQESNEKVSTSAVNADEVGDDNVNIKTDVSENDRASSSACNVSNDIHRLASPKPSVISIKTPQKSPSIFGMLGIGNAKPFFNLNLDGKPKEYPFFSHGLTEAEKEAKKNFLLKRKQNIENQKDVITTTTSNEN